VRRSPLLVVHPELDEQQRIVEALAPLGHPIECAADLRSATEYQERVGTALVVVPDPGVPIVEPWLVERIQRESTRVPIIVLIDEPAQVKCPVAVRLLLGLQHYLVWPEEADHLPVVAHGLLRTADLLTRVRAEPGQPGWIPELREAGHAQQRRDLLSALRVTHGNITQAAEMLGLSRGGLQYRLKKFGIDSRSTVVLQEPG
jgi:DNA-binding NtrC family response regulator